jgi:TRAP transporter TAXI family solute receptor
MRLDPNKGVTRVQTIFMETFGMGRAVAIAAMILIFAIILFALFWFFHSAPPNTITISTGPVGSVFETTAKRYAAILARDHVKLNILPSQGSLENLKRLLNRSSPAEVGFVQGGVAGGLNIEKLVSLGSVNYEPLVIFYRSTTHAELLSELAGKRLAIGPEGSGTRLLALVLLKANSIEPGGTTALLDLDADDAAGALIEGKVDAAFMMGDSASPQVMLKLLRTPGIHMFNFTQADAYTRRFVYLNKLELPQGSIDFGKNIPDHDVWLIGPTVELIARPDLHPALSDLLIEAATEVHGKAGLLKRQGEFPAPLEHEFRISSDAIRFYKSGKGFLYRSLPFRFASLANRILVAFVPMVVLLIPVLRIIPVIYRWRVKLRIYRWYRLLLVLEQELVASSGSESREAVHARLDKIAEDVNKMKVPASFGDQFYVLRQHISFVQSRLTESKH